MISKRLTIGIIAFMTLVAIGSGYYVYRKEVEAGYPSCVLSIEDAISRELVRGSVKILVVTDEWQTLTEDEEQALFTEFQSADLKFDCLQFPRFADGSALVGTNGQIRFRRDGRLVRVQIDSIEGHAK